MAKRILAGGWLAVLLFSFPPAATAGEDVGSSGASCAVPASEVPASLRALVAERQAKCQKLEPYRQGWLERQLMLIERADRPPFDRMNWQGFYPRVQAIDHRSQLAFGLRFWRPGTFGSRLDLHGSAFESIGGMQYAEAQAGVVPHGPASLPAFAFKGDDVFEIVNVRPDDDHPFTIYGSWYYRWSPRYDYYGAGPDAALEDHADFREKDQLVELVAGARVLRRLSVIGRAGRWRASTGQGTDDALPNVDAVFSPAEIPGYGEKLEFFRYGGSLVFDTRDLRGNPHRGLLLAVQAQQFDQLDGDGYSFRRLCADAQLYLSLGHPQRVLALRAYLTRDDPEQGGRVPFFALAAIGSGRTLRAFESQRFRGERIGLLQGEYRVEMAPALELAFFCDAGAVSSSGAEKVSGWRSDGGVGLRVKSHESVLLRTDFAWGNEGFRFLFRFGSSF
jgi:hypothetical protein